MRGNAVGVFVIMMIIEEAMNDALVFSVDISTFETKLYIEY